MLQSGLAKINKKETGEGMPAQRLDADKMQSAMPTNGKNTATYILLFSFSAEL